MSRSAFLFRRVVLGFAAALAGFALVGCSSLFPSEPGPKLEHFEELAPRVGQAAPDFTLLDLDGQPVRLSDRLGERPVVLQFGSHTCPVYRYRRHSMRPLMEEYRDRVDFLIVYTLEAHPAGSVSPYHDREWRSLVNRLTGVKLDQPADQDERVERASWSRDKLEWPAEMVVDGMDNQAWKLYGRASSPAFVLAEDGIVELSQVWLDPDEIRHTLRRLLNEVPADP